MSKTRPVVLILSNSRDGIHTEIVQSKLVERGVSVFRLDTDKISDGTILVNFQVTNCGSGFEIYNRVTQKGVLSSEVGSVWYRRPNVIEIGIDDPVQKKQAETELKSFLDGLWLTLPKAFWVSPMSALERARRKVLQLTIAKEIGLQVPDTLITNDPKRAKEFFRMCKNQMIFKCLGEQWLDYEENSFRIPTTLITEKHLEHIEFIQKTPALFQSFVEKAYDMRVTVVGNTIFAAKIDSQRDPLTSVDWRHPERMEFLNHSPIKLPQKLHDGCLGLVRKLGLQFGAIDFALDKSGQYHFLEINPNGQWYWLEHLVKFSISDTLTTLLLPKI